MENVNPIALVQVCIGLDGMHLTENEGTMGLLIMHGTRESDDGDYPRDQVRLHQCDESTGLLC